MPTLDRITIYPVKSLDGVEVSRALVLPSGALENDRRWRLVDIEGSVVNAKRTPLLHALGAEFALVAPAAGLLESAGSAEVADQQDHARAAAGSLSIQKLITLWVMPDSLLSTSFPDADRQRLRTLAQDSFHLMPGKEGPCEWLSEALGHAVFLEEKVDGGFPDDREAMGPTLISTATLLEVARWFGFDLAESRRRFRSNLEIGDCDAFWEDTLACPKQSFYKQRQIPPGASGPPLADPYADLPSAEPQPFSLGQAQFLATKLCNRCVVPSRDSRTATPSAHFRDAFEARRRQGLRADVDVSGSNHLYKLAVNTRPQGPAGAHTLIAIGDGLTTGR